MFDAIPSELELVGKGPDRALEAQRELGVQVEESRKAVEALTSFAVANGADVTKFNHLSEVWNPDKYLSMPVNYMPPNTAGLTSAETGDVLVREDRVTFRNVLHESIHRAAHLRIIRENGAKDAEVLAGLYGYQITADNRSVEPLDPSVLDQVPEADREAFLKGWGRHIRLASEVLTEGITEWVTQRANGLTTPDGDTIMLDPEEKGYPLHTEIVETFRDICGLSPEQFDALLIQTGLSGDIGNLVTRFQDTYPFLEYLSELTPILEDYKKF